MLRPEFSRIGGGDGGVGGPGAAAAGGAAARAGSVKSWSESPADDGLVIVSPRSAVGPDIHAEGVAAHE
jgi:hypothetical protein